MDFNYINNSNNANNSNVPKRRIHISVRNQSRSSHDGLSSLLIPPPNEDSSDGEHRVRARGGSLVVGAKPKAASHLRSQSHSNPAPTEVDKWTVPSQQPLWSEELDKRYYRYMCFI